MTTLALPPSHNTLTELPTFERAVYGYLAQYRGKTFEAYKADLKNWLAWCDGKVHPLQVGRDHLNLYVQWMQNHPARWADSTIARRIGTVCGLYKYLCDEEVIAKDPSRRVSRPRVDRDKQRCTYLPPVDFATLIKYTVKHGTPTEQALIALIGMRGLRIGEATSLDIGDFTEARGYRIVKFIGKGGKARSVVVPVPAVPLIEAAIGDRTEGPILTNAWGQRMSRITAARLVKNLAAAAGVDNDISNHSLRRSFATAGIAKGESLYEISLAMGHASMDTTKRYDRLANNMDRDVSQGIAGFLSNLAG